MAAAIVGLIALFLAVPLLVFHLWALIDVLRTPGTAWTRTGQSQLLWGIVVLMLSLLGPLLYVVIARPRLRALEGTEPHRLESRSSTRLVLGVALLVFTGLAIFTALLVLLARGGSAEDSSTGGLRSGRTCTTRQLSTVDDGPEVCIVEDGLSVSIEARGLLADSTLTVRGAGGDTIVLDAGAAGALQAQLADQLVESSLSVEGTWADGEALSFGVEYEP